MLKGTGGKRLDAPVMRADVNANVYNFLRGFKMTDEEVMEHVLG